MSTRSPSAGGVMIASGAIVGTAIGISSGQPTIGFLAGMSIGVVIALAIWWKDR